MGRDNCHPQPEDLIAIYWPGFQHWTLYVGDGYVIHLTNVGSNDVFISVGSCSNRKGKAKVKKELLKEVVGNNKWRVNNKYDRSRTPLPVKEIIQRAEQWIDTEVPYNTFLSNCEHFVTMLRYGEELSDQVTNAVVGGTAAAALGILGAVGALVATALSKGTSRS